MESSLPIKLDCTEVFRALELENEKPPSTFSRIYASFLRRAKIRWNYKVWIVFDFASTIISIFTYYLLSFIVTNEQIVFAGYAGTYFAFALIGVSFDHFISASIRSLGRTLRLEQYYGTLESVVSTETSISTVFLGDFFYYFVYSIIFMIVGLSLGYVLGAGIILNIPIILQSAVIIILMVLSHLPIGLLSAAMILKYKQGNPISWALTWINQFFSGAFFPIHLMPHYLRVISYVLPLTFSLDALRRVFINGESIFSVYVSEDILFMTVYSLIMLPLAFFIFNKMYNNVRKEGTIGAY